MIVMDAMSVIAIILGVLLSLSEILALIPSVKANSVFQMFVNAVKTIKDALFGKKEGV